MQDPIRIMSLQLENVKRVRAVALTPTPTGLTILGGRNGQGKTSVLDAIAWALGGDRYRPSAPQRDGSTLPPSINLTLSNGLKVERKGKSSALTVTDPAGKRYGQALLNEFVGQFAIDLPRFLQASDRDKADTLLKIIGVGDKLRDLERREQDTYNRRHALGQIADQKAKFAREMPLYEGVPDEPVSAADLIRQQQAILLRNAENQRIREQAALWADKTARQRETVADLEERLAEARAMLTECEDKLAIARKDALDLHDESTAELEENIRSVEDINRKVRANLDREKAQEDAQQLSDEYNSLTVQLDNLRQMKRDLLNGAKLPLQGLTVEGGKLLYRGHAWDGMSSSDQLIVGTAIARALQPACGFVLLDRLEQLDEDTLQRFGQWLEYNGLQAIATRVGTGSECTVIIEDGCVAGAAASAPAPTWTKGVF